MSKANNQVAWHNAHMLDLLALFGLVSMLLAGCATRNYPGPVHGLTFDGTLQSIDPQQHQLVLAPLKPGPPVTFAYETTTKFWRNGIPIHADELEPGRSARVHYHWNAEQRVAHHLYLQVPYAPH